MTKTKTTSVEIAAARLRALALKAESGELIGSEDAMIEALGFSRPTVRQAARMLEREGLIRVRRGIGGGYLAARPDTGTIEQLVSAYMESRSVEADEMTSVTAALWIEVVRRAASLADPSRKALAEKLSKRMIALPSDSTLQDAVALEEAIRIAMFGLVNVPYIELIFQITETFARRRMLLVDGKAGTPVEFVQAWRSAKMLELDAIATGDPEVAVIAAGRVRSLWRRCVVAGMMG